MPASVDDACNRPGPTEAVGDLLSVIIPAFNEEAAIASTVRTIRDAINPIGMRSEIIVVDDGSTDRTFERVEQMVEETPGLVCVQLSRNFGKESALLAGLRQSRGDAVVTIDADLQHPPSLIADMVECWKNGFHVIHGVKQNRSHDGSLVRFRARLFNAVMNKLTGGDFSDASDFKLLDRKVVQVITQQLSERSRFYRGLVGWVGFRQTRLPFSVSERTEGQGKWSTHQLVVLARTAIVSFSNSPLRMVTAMGTFALVFTAIVAGDALVSRYMGKAVSGFTTLIIAILLMGSLIMLSLGIIGEYIANIYEEQKQRPPFLIEKIAARADSMAADTGEHQDRTDTAGPPTGISSVAKHDRQQS